MSNPNTTTDYETLVIYAGTMRFLLDTNDILTRFGVMSQYMSEEMNEVLFELVSIYISIRSQGLIGVSPILSPYKRISPLFYYLTELECIYFTTEDELKGQFLTQQELSEEYKDYLTRQRELASNQSKKQLNQRFLTEERESKKQVFSEAITNEITHRELKSLTILQRRAMMSSQARNEILKTLEVFNRRFPDPIPLDQLITASTPIQARFNPLFSYDFSFEDTFQRVSNYQRNFSAEYARLEVLKKVIANNPRDKKAQREYTTLKEQIGITKPFQKLLEKFHSDADGLEKAYRRSNSNDQRLTAYEQLEENLRTYAEIVNESVARTIEVGNANRDKVAIFSNS